jgi:Transposase DDE domain
MRDKWHVRKGYLKIHIAVNIKKKRILSLEVTSEEVHDGKVLKKLVDSGSENNNLKGVLADGMYDSSNKNFRYLSKNHNKPGIKTRSNSKVKSTNCHARNMSVLTSLFVSMTAQYSLSWFLNIKGNFSCANRTRISGFGSFLLFLLLRLPPLPPPPLFFVLLLPRFNYIRLFYS